MNMQGRYGCLVFVVLLLGTTPSLATSPQEPTEKKPFAPFKCDHLREATVKYGNSDLVITLQDAELMKQLLEEYLAKKKHKMDPSVTGPGEVFITCDGNVRMGAWRLESSLSDERELHLTFLVPTGANFRVHEVVSLQQVEGQWRVTGSGRRTAHLRY